MLRKEEEFEQNGATLGQKLADELYGVGYPQENALPATTLHQTFGGLVLEVDESYLGVGQQETLS